MHDFIIGVFRNGKLLYAINKVRCTHAQAALIVAALDLGKSILCPGEYFAADYCKNLF